MTGKKGKMRLYFFRGEIRVQVRGICQAWSEDEILEALGDEAVAIDIRTPFKVDDIRASIARCDDITDTYLES